MYSFSFPDRSRDCFKKFQISFSVLGEGQRGIKGVNARSPKHLFLFRLREGQEGNKRGELPRPRTPYCIFLAFLLRIIFQIFISKLLCLTSFSCYILRVSNTFIQFWMQILWYFIAHLKSHAIRPFSALDFINFIVPNTSFFALY